MAAANPNPQPVFQQLDRTAKRPYPLSYYIGRMLWSVVYALLFRYSIPRAFGWRRMILRCFKAKVTPTTVIYRSVRIYHPWLLSVGHHTTIAREVDLYNLGPITIGNHTVISHRATLCAGTHDYTRPELPLLRPPIHVGSGVWIATEAFIGPNVTIGDNSIIGARAVVIKDIPPGVVAAGNPARVLKDRPIERKPRLIVMRIITNADDFGMDEQTVRATIECLDAGSLTSATIMPNMPATGLAIEYAKKHPEKSFGVHLTYITDTVEAPLCPAATLPTLAAPNGKFFDSQTVRFNALRNRLAIDVIERETAAQIQRLVDLGVTPSHVDSHGHLHKFKPFRLALKNVLPRFGITKVRNVQNIYLKKPLKSPTFWLGGIWRRKVMKLFTTTQNFFMPMSETSDVSWSQNLLPRVNQQQTLEVGVHPGYTEAWRDAERRAIHTFAQAARDAGHELVGWREL